jgi:hypothetical protein
VVSSDLERALKANAKRREAANADAHVKISQDSWCKAEWRHTMPWVRCNQPPGHDGAHGFLFVVDDNDFAA